MRLVDSANGINRTFHYDHAERKIGFGFSQDAEPILDRNKAFQNEGQSNKAWRKVAEIPVTLIYKWLVDDGIDIAIWSRWKKAQRLQFYKKKLNDPDYRYLKATTGRV